MITPEGPAQVAGSPGGGLPKRLHHNAYVTRDLAATRRFYEDIIGLPLIATWCEADQLWGAERVYCHVFFGLADGGALAFFKFADAEVEAHFAPKMPYTPFNHIALQVDQETQHAIEQRLQAAGYREPQTYVHEHGYCRSLYAVDPNGMIVEFTLDRPEMADLAASIRAKAHAELERWQAGDYSSNNMFRGKCLEAPP
jgi:glyoxylase I family protein